MILSVFDLRARLEGTSRREAQEHAEFYTRGGEASTIKTYNTGVQEALQVLQGVGQVDLRVIRERRGIVHHLESQEGSVGDAVEAGAGEICWFSSPSVSPIVNKVKMAAIKQKNEGMKKMVRVGRVLETAFLQNGLPGCLYEWRLLLAIY